MASSSTAPAAGLSSTAAAAAAGSTTMTTTHSALPPAVPQPQRPREQKGRPQGWVHFAAGGVAGMCGAIVTSPLDVVKTRLQSDLFQPTASSRSSSTVASAAASSASAAARHSGAFSQTRRLAYHFVETAQLLRTIATREGPRALFRGLGPTLFGAVPARSINFYTYGNGKVLLAEHLNGGKESPAVHLAAAAMAGIVTATATNPIWVVKTRLQLEASAAERSRESARSAAVGRQAAAPGSAPVSSRALSTSALASTSAVRGGASLDKAFYTGANPAVPRSTSTQMVLHILRSEGIAGLYRGMSASYLGVVEGTIQWVLYEKLKRWERKGEGEEKPQGLRTTIGAAGTAKLIASLITYPHEVLRTRMRQQPSPGEAPKYTSLRRTILLVWRDEGAAALYGGLSAHLLRVVPNAAIMFSVYELALWLAAPPAQ